MKNAKEIEDKVAGWFEGSRIIGFCKDKWDGFNELSWWKKALVIAVAFVVLRFVYNKFVADEPKADGKPTPISSYPNVEKWRV